MKTTKHCQKRQQQRRISDSLINLALSLGDVGNTDKIMLGKQEVEDLNNSIRLLINRLQTV